MKKIETYYNKLNKKPIKKNDIKKLYYLKKK